jgi:SAM-dependent methyltransferase
MRLTRIAVLAGLAALLAAAARPALASARRRAVAQASGPHGRWAGLVAAALNRGNAAINRMTLDAVSPAPGERLLDLGFGGGTLIERALAEHPGVRVVGADPSEDMVARLAEHLAPDIASGRLELVVASAESLPLPDGALDCLTSVYTVYFWPDAARGLAEVRRVLRPGGRVALAVTPPGLQRAIGFDREGFSVRSGADVAALMHEAGLVDVALHDAPHGSAIVTGREPGPAAQTG